MLGARHSLHQPLPQPEAVPLSVFLPSRTFDDPFAATVGTFPEPELGQLSAHLAAAEAIEGIAEGLI